MDMDKAIEKTLETMGLILDFKLKPQQEEVLKHFVCGNDCLAVFPTSYGKSLIYQMAPLVYKNLNATDDTNCCIVVSPLNSLTADQIQSAKKLNLEAKKLTIGTKLSDLDDCHLIYSTPEMLLEECHRETLISIASRLVGIVVDEAHLVIKWGQQSRMSKAFRKQYSEIAKLKVYFNRKPIICLTATANRKTRTGIIRTLELKNAKLIKFSPDKPNVKLNVVKVAGEEHFVEILEPILEKI
ncbi:ATP-dependent DNA helicase RecQ-like [Clytia hemisphaerica]